MPPAPQSRVLALVALLLLLTSAGTAVERFRGQPATDFYHYWGIATARSVSAADLGSPYAQRAAYVGVLNDLADRSEDAHLKFANKRRRAVDAQGSPYFFDPTGTPFFYACFAFLPLDFGRAYALWQAAQFAALLAAVGVLGIALGQDRTVFALLAAAATLFFGPFLTDLRVGNVNAFQLLALALLVAVGRALRAFEEPARRTRLATLYAVGLAVLALFKPNLLPLLLLLAAHLWCSAGPRAFARASLVAALVALALAALSCLYFRSAAVWREWFDFVYGDDPAKLPSYAVSAGNVPPGAVLAQQYGGLAPMEWSIAIAVALAASLVAAAAGRRAGGIGAGLRSMLSDPFLAASLGLLASFACSPLVWFHYFVLALLPLCWLACAPERTDARAWLAALGFAIYSGVLDVPMRLLGAEAYFGLVLAFGWLPLWIAALIHARRGGGAIVDRAVAR